MHKIQQLSLAIDKIPHSEHINPSIAVTFTSLSTSIYYYEFIGHFQTPILPSILPDPVNTKKPRTTHAQHMRSA